MNKGRISKRNLLARLPLMAAVAFVCFPHVAKAQQGNPEIFVDMSVLQGLGPAPTQPQPPVKLKPPAPKPPAAIQPQLIAPTTPTQAAPAYTPPPRPAAAPAKDKAYVSKPPEMPAEDVRHAISSPQQPAPASAPLKSAPPPVMPEAVAVKETVAIPPIPAVENTTTPAAPVPEPVVFPVKTKVRTEVTDPAAMASSRPVPVRSGIAGNLNDTVLSRPAPDFDPTATSEESDSIPVRDLTEEPEGTATPESVKTASSKPAVVPGRKPSVPQKSEEKAPEKIADTSTPAVVPPRRPEVQKAPPELVAELRAREAAKLEATSEKAPSVDLTDPPPPPGPRGKKNMPAVAKAPVESEKLAEQLIKLPANSDPLLDRLVEKDKQDLVATIESMVAAREDGKPLPENKKPPREQGSNIVRAEPMQRPYNVYRPKKEESEVPMIEDLVTAKIEEKIEALEPTPAAEEIKTAAIEKATPAAGIVTPRPPPPGNQDEQAYVSVPFSAGLTELDAKITSEIETRLLPVLNDNPGWKLQIQAFASPVKDGVSSARKASLARAMSVRGYLLSKGIEATRMDIRALGAESDRDPMDRVDLIVFDPAKKS